MRTKFPDIPPLCACGCGMRVTGRRDAKRWNLYILHHGGKRVTPLPECKPRIKSGRLYVWVRKEQKRVANARIVMAKVLNRPLLPFPEEIVHHVDGNPLNDNPDNLQPMSNSEHVSYHSKFSKRKKKRRVKKEKPTPVPKIRNLTLIQIAKKRRDDALLFYFFMIYNF